MLGLLDVLKMGAAGVAGALVAGTIFYQVGHWKGETFGREAERAASLQRSMDLIRERSETNADINALDDAALCRELGGKWVQPDNICQ